MKDLLKVAFSLVVILSVLSCDSCTDQFNTCLDDYSSCVESCETEDCKLDCGDTFKTCTGTEFIFPIHFCVVTNNDSASTIATLDQLKKEVDILNEFFTAEDASLAEGRRKLVTFTFKSAHFYSDVSGLGSDLVDQLDQDAAYDGTAIQTKFNAETNPLVRDQNAINIYIYDSWTSSSGRGNANGHARRNSNFPYLLLDYARINHGVQAPEEHEMGHAFGLAHICASVASSTVSSNIMTSTGNYPADGSLESGGTEISCGGTSGGARDIGFNSTQSGIILRYAEEIHDALGL